MHRIDEIRNVAYEYGNRSAENMRLGEKLGREIIGAFDRYLSPDGGLVTGVPPFGDWNPEAGDYCDAAFSYYHRPVLVVRDTQIGLSVKIFDHLWTRLIVTVMKQGERIAVSVGDRDPAYIPVDYTPMDIERVCDLLFEAVMRLYRDDVNVFVHGNDRLKTIGFRHSAD